jgi:tetraacyldisaccharide 4'-kinase
MAVQDVVSQHQLPPRTWPAPPAEPAPAFDWRLLLYNIALTLLAPLLAAYLLWRMAGRGKSRGGWGERLGRVPPQARYRPGGPRVWIHAVSAGEVAGAACLLDAIKRVLPEAQVLVSTTTATGRPMAARSCVGADAIFHFPLDLLPAVERALRLTRPDLCLLVEGELWPNFLSAARRHGIPTMVVNGRVSDRTTRRLQALGPLFRWVVGRVDRFCMQSRRDVERIVALGAQPARVAQVGNVKFDQAGARVAPGERERLARELGVAGAQTVVIAASTHPGEERIALDAFNAVRQVDPAARLIIAPRHIGRAREVEQVVAQAGLRSRRRTQGPPGAAEGPNTVIILDTMGELERVYAVATAAFIGGSFAPVGGHNVLQATAQGIPCVFGPHMHKSRDTAGVITEAGLGVQVRTPQALGMTLASLIQDRKRLAAIRRSSGEVLARHRGAADRCALAAAEMLGYRPPGMQSTPGAGLRAFVVGALSGADRRPAARALVGMLAPASALYWIGLKLNRLAYALGLARVTRLPARVISVGNLTAGGTGKTSAAALLAADAVGAGKRTAVLSRGYGRRCGAGKAELVSDGKQVMGDHLSAGDEPLLLAREAAGAAVLVGKDRRQTGRRAVETLGAEMLILDDGFQYWRLAKDREIVLIDALCPFGNGLLLPAGILREPLSHLRRASAVWITHADLAAPQRVAELRRRLGRVFRGPIRETVHRPLDLRALEGEEAMDLGRLPEQPVAALSGIGNPRAFELTLERLGARVLPLRFPDHHRYRGADCAAIERFARCRGARIVTTAKDAVRLWPGAFTQPVWVLRVQMAAAQGGLGLEWEGEPEQP